MRDITVIRYSGKIEPWETYSLGFEIGGRVATARQVNDRRRLRWTMAIGSQAGQELARLDDRSACGRAWPRRSPTSSWRRIRHGSAAERVR